MHIEIYSRKGNAKGASTRSIFAEAKREDGACPHVAEPIEPEVVYGMTLDDLEVLHDMRADLAQSTMKNGKQRKIRVDQNTLGTCVMSYPGKLATADPASVKEWEERSIAWLKEEYGDQLKCVIRHTDEEHPHLHAYMLPECPEMRASALHHGYVAKATTLAAGGDNKAGDRAYRDAMRAAQDRYWNKVGLPMGLARIGPGRRRLSREAWRQEQMAQMAVRAAIVEQRKVKDASKKIKEQAFTHIEMTKARAAEIAASALAEADNVKGDARKLLQQAKSEQQVASRLMSAARAELAKIEGFSAKIGSIWTTVKRYVSSAEAKAEKRLADEIQKAKDEAQEKVGDFAVRLNNERQKTKNLRASLQELSHDLRTIRQELGELKKQKNEPPRPRGPRR